MDLDMETELLYDFCINIPRILISGKTIIIDNVKRVLNFTEKCIVVDGGLNYTSISGEGFVIKKLEDERLLIMGNISLIEFYPCKKG